MSLPGCPIQQRIDEEVRLREHQRSGDESSSERTALLAPKRPSFLRSRLWWSGLALMSLGEGGNFLSYGLAPASIVAPLGAVSLLSNVAIAPALLHEHIEGVDVLGIALAIIGSVAVVLCIGAEGGKQLSPPALWHALRDPSFLLYAVCSLALGATLMLLSSTRFGERRVLVDVGTCAVFGGFTVLATKGVSSFLLERISTDVLGLLREPLFFALVLVIIVTAMIQLKYLNSALQRFDSRQVIPTQFVLFTISTIIGSSLLYHDFARTSIVRLVGFAAGCTITFLGVYVMTRQKIALAEPAADDGVHEIQIPVPNVYDNAHVNVRASRADAGFGDESTHAGSRHARSRSRSALAAVAAIVSSPQSYLLSHADDPYGDSELHAAGRPRSKSQSAQREERGTSSMRSSASFSRILPQLFRHDDTYVAISEPSGARTPHPAHSVAHPTLLGISPGRNLLLIANQTLSGCESALPSPTATRSLDPSDAYARQVDS